MKIAITGTGGVGDCFGAKLALRGNDVSFIARGAHLAERPFHGVDGRRADLRAARALRTEELSLHMEDVQKLVLPTLIVWGRRETFQPLHLAERLAEKMPNAQIQVFDEAGHFLPEDLPEVLAACISEFASSLEVTC